MVVMALKYLAYRITGSVALYSDALESIVIVITAAVALWAVWLSGKPADARHLGCCYPRLEDTSSLLLKFRSVQSKHQ